MIIPTIIEMPGSTLTVHQRDMPPIDLATVPPRWDVCHESFQIAH